MNALVLYRISNWLYKHHIPILPKLLQLLVFLLFNCYIPYQIKMGRGCKIGHRGIGVVINKDAVIGNDVLIRAHVTIGKKDSNSPAPVIGNKVVLGDGSKIIGNITIGDGVVVGANAVVVKDIEKNSIVGGVPAKLIGKVN
ncbi:MAG: serine acetyltransferase [Pseudomonadota bacterium]